ncbi:MAG: HEAT repeat domain-containing protein, partial [Planctomycetota bacterium]|nr:HEAT repeat domain-containing protein [Planctomycetota bacterium]
TDDDGVADVREEWYQGHTLTGCANDMHGPFLGPDGLIYWCKGAWAEQTYERPGREPLVSKASHILRRRVDGTGIEPVMTGGMDNPVDVAFTAGGERIFTSTFLQHPGGGKRDGLLHAVYGGVYGKVHAPMESAPRTGDVMPTLLHLGAAAPCGLTRYDAAVLGEDYRDNLFACLFNMHKVTRHELLPAGATFSTRDTDFLVSDSLDFHPTDVFEDADGSLIVVDTGGWYKLCCPTSQLWKPDVLGAVYRIRKTDAPKIDDPRGLRISFDKLGSGATRFLADRRPAVRHRATQTLIDAGFNAVAPLAELLNSPQPRVRLRAVRVLSQIDHPQAREAIRTALGNSDETVRQAAGHAVSLSRDPEALTPLIELLRNPSAQNRRVAAEALGRLNDGRAVRPLLDAAQAAGDDRFLEHSITFALIDLAAPRLVEPSLTDPNPRVARAALVSLDQMEGGGLQPQSVAQLLASPEPLLRETAVWIAGRRPEWGPALADFLKGRLNTPDLPEADQTVLVDLLAKFARAAEVQQVLADALLAEAPAGASLSLALKSMAKATLAEMPATWGTGLTRVLTSGSAENKALAIAATRAISAPKAGLPELTAAAVAVARDATLDASFRRQALAAAPGGPGELDEGLFALVVEPLRREAEVAQRLSAVEVATRSKLNPAQLIEIARLMTSVGPLEADRLLSVFKDQTDLAVGNALVAGLNESTAMNSLRVDALKATFAKFPAEIQAAAQPLYDRLNAEAGRQKEKLAAVMESLKTKTGDVRRGQAIFHGNKTACVVCHAMGYLGGSVGPDLTRIGGVRSEQDLLESILFPSLTFVRSYEPVVIVTKAGKPYSGNVRSEGPDGVVLTIAPKEEVRISRDDIEEIRPGTVSVMPSGLDQQLTEQDLADLLAFLKGSK